MRKYRAVMILVMVVAFLVTAFALEPDKPAFAKTKKYTVTTKQLENGRVMDMVGLPHNHDTQMIPPYQGKTPELKGFQNFDMTPDGKYMMGSVECQTTGPKAIHTMIVRCRIQQPQKMQHQISLPAEQADMNARSAVREENDLEGGDDPYADHDGPCAVCEDATLLAKFGHGEVLCITQPDQQKEEYNLWVGCTPGKGEKAQAKEIARVTYTVSPTDNRAKITKVVKITGFNKGNVKKGKAAYFDRKPSVDRVNCAVDTGSNQVVFRVKLIKGKVGQGTRYLSYDLKKLNAALNKVGNNRKYSITKAAKWQKAHVYFALTPLDALQSFDVAGKTLYLAGGNFGLGSQIYALNYKIQKNGKTTPQNFYKKGNINTIITMPNKLTTYWGETFGKNKLEIEGMKVEKKGKKTNYYVNYLFQGVGLRYGVSIYKFTR